MFEPLRTTVEATAGEPPLQTPQRRHAILDHEVERMIVAGYYLLTRIDHIAILACERSFGLIKVFVDEYGNVRHD